MGGDRLLQARGIAVSRPEPAEGIPKGILGGRPVERHVLARLKREQNAITLDRRRQSQVVVSREAFAYSASASRRNSCA